MIKIFNFVTIGIFYLLLRNVKKVHDFNKSVTFLTRKKFPVFLKSLILEDLDTGKFYIRK